MGSGTLNAFQWYGGKSKHLKWLLPLLAETRFYVEPFGGSAAVLLNRPRVDLETLNDINGRIVNFFRVLRDSPDELVEQIAATPYSREEYYWALHEPPGTDPVEEARKFYVAANQGYVGKTDHQSVGSWGHSRASSGSRANMWRRKLPRLAEIAERLQGVQIEHEPAVVTIERYDSADTLIYCDPPYLMETRITTDGYEYEMDADAWAQLADLLSSCKAKVAVSTYDSPLLDSMFDPDRWTPTYAPAKKLGNSHQSLRRELLLTNYPVQEGS